MLKFLEIVVLITTISLNNIQIAQAIVPQMTSEVKLKQLQPVKVFQIGFNKCGTSTLTDFFNENGVKSVHCDDGKLAVDIWNNHLSHKPLLSEKYDQYWGYFDMEEPYANPPIYIAQKLFRELDKQYPGSKFILNIRNKAAWIKSRSLHRNTFGISYLEIMTQKYKISKDAVLKMWANEWDAHILAVLKHFKDRPNDLLVFNIDEDKPEKFCDFFKDNFVLDPKLYAHKNKTLTK